MAFFLCRTFLPKTSKYDLEVSFCQLNMSQCNVTENADRFIVNVYNPVPRTVDKYVRVPVNINGMLAWFPSTGFEWYLGFSMYTCTY